MMTIRKWVFPLLLLSAILGALSLSGCSSQADKNTKPLKTIKVGTLSGPHAEILEEVKKVAATKGLNIQILEFGDYIQPNAALDQGEIDANAFQHLPFLENHVKDRGYKIISLGKTVLFPMGVYSSKIKSVDEIQPGMTVGIPNDPSNGGRALEILEKAGLITLEKTGSAKVGVNNITSNPKNLVIKEIDAALLPRTLDDLDFAVINNSFASKSGLVPTKDAFILEGNDSPYANILAIRESDKDNPDLKLLLECYQSPEVKQFIDEHFKGSAIAAW